MRRLLLTIVAVLACCTACLAQVSTLGTTSMGLATTPGAIVISPLDGPSPYSSTTLSGTPVTTLAPVPMASEPATPGTFVICAPLQFTTFSTQPAASFMTLYPNSAVPSPSSAASALASPAMMPVPSPAMGPASVPVQGTTAATMASTTTMSPLAMTPATALGTIPSPIFGSTTGTISPLNPPLGGSATIACSSTLTSLAASSASLPLSTPEIPNTPAPGTIQPTVTELASTSIDPATGVMPTPNAPACAESMTMNLATPGTMSPANATGAAATPGVSPVSPSGC
jgi:hypothetical protein